MRPGSVSCKEHSFKLENVVVMFWWYEVGIYLEIDTKSRINVVVRFCVDFGDDGSLELVG